MQRSHSNITVKLWKYFDGVNHTIFPLYLKGNSNSFSSLELEKAQKRSWNELELDVKINKWRVGQTLQAGASQLKGQSGHPSCCLALLVALWRCWCVKGVCAMMPFICKQDGSEHWNYRFLLYCLKMFQYMHLNFGVLIKVRGLITFEMPIAILTIFFCCTDCIWL